ncbi:PhoX family protein [Paeniglutamicibacter kerguelensis]|uniref:Secreted PhoX family phosphatase n=1 Tax=Paeniglutamicibacter kerguelensis TaxID=254788 RepID=A0ABS4XEZ1_9MICC|nr:PhoX family phosphatase [Paeniglutamicibacter kerguelensis]MBP2387025.1 secreted PhoX family phosphatase [Paeniglutamicibacter kerguelensis]
MIQNRTLLPMIGHTRGNRNAATCQFKCGNACAKDVCNTSDNEYFRDIADAALSRRSVLGLGAVASAALVIGGEMLRAPSANAQLAAAPGNGGKLQFKAIAPVPRSSDVLTVPEGYDWSPVIRWGDPLFKNSPIFDITKQSAKAQAGQFGYNNDYLNLIVDKYSGRSGVLVANHEYTNEDLMFDPEWFAANKAEAARIAMAAHGFSVVEIKRGRASARWEYVRGGERNRRITASTAFAVDGPAAGSALLKTAADPSGRKILGTLNNCSGGTTPWGTVISGEENFNQYFRGTGSATDKRYGIADAATERGWEDIDQRFSAHNKGFENESNRFGWIVEIDPQNPDSTPVKHTALGRFKHEGANIRIAADGRAVAYSGDDERFDYVYKFISKEKYRRGDRKHNLRLLSDGDLYVARFSGDSPAGQIDGAGAVPSDGEFDGTGTWLPLVLDGRSRVPGMSVEEVLVYTRLAADKVGATKMDRPEDVEPSPVSGKLYIALTNNTQRGTAGKAAVDEANPRTGNRDGHVIELTERKNDAAAIEFSWNILLVAGDPSKDASTYFAGYPKDKVSPIACPDNLAFDSKGNLWISTDGQPGTIGYCDALHKVTLTGNERGKVEQFLAVPAGAETCGPVIHDKDGSVFVSVQHPGEGGSYDKPISFFPDYVATPGKSKRGEVYGPRPSVVQVYATGKPGRR